MAGRRTRTPPDLASKLKALLKRDMPEEDLLQKILEAVTANENLANIDERVLLVKHSLLEVQFQNGWRRSELLEMINRLLLLTPDTVVVGIYEEVERENSPALYVQVMDTFYDYGLRKAFSKQIEKYHLSARKSPKSNEAEQSLDTDAPSSMVSVLRSNHKNLAHKIHGTPYYCVFWRIDTTNDLSIVPLEAHDGVARLFERLFRKPSDRIPRQLFSRALQRSLEHIKEDSQRHIVRKKLLLQDRTEDGAPRRAVQIANRVLTDETVPFSIIKVLDEIYDLYAQSPLLINNTAGVSNLIFFWKSFSRTEPRFGAYNYDVRCLLPKKQRADLIYAFDKDRTDRNNRHSEEKADLPSVVAEAEAEVHKHLDQGKQIDASGQSGFDKFFSLVMGANESIERSFLEYTLSSGVINFRRSPLTPGRLGIMRGGGNIERAHQRAAALRAVLRLMAPAIGPDNKSGVEHCIVQLPIRIASAPVASMCTIRTQEIRDGNIDDLAFFSSFHFMHDIGEHATRWLRRKLENAYGEAITERFEHHMRQGLQLIEKHRGKHRVPVSSIMDAISRDCLEMCRVFPFPQIKLMTLSQLNASKDQGLQTSERIPIFDYDEPVRAVRTRNPFFDRLGDAWYIEVDDIAIRLRAAMARIRSESLGLLSVTNSDA
jgi:hypothetical protein